ncbi:MAG: hypothetical protein GY784_11275 [Gammaproteobacteria bacterium]|nr:hypothetical protein [Gammaproteobacteria bacterium]
MKDLGMQAIKSIAEIWQIDEERIIWHDNGFDWWPSHYRQTIRVGEPIEYMNLEGFQIAWVCGLINKNLY